MIDGHANYEHKILDIIFEADVKAHIDFNFNP